MSQGPIETFGLRGSRTYGAGSSSNPLVVHAPSRPAYGLDNMDNPFSGLRLVEDADSLSRSIRDGDWLSGALAGVGTVVDGVAMAM